MFLPTLYSREQRAKRACLHAHLATAARVNYPAACSGAFDSFYHKQPDGKSLFKVFYLFSILSVQIRHQNQSNPLPAKIMLNLHVFHIPCIYM